MSIQSVLRFASIWSIVLPLTLGVFVYRKVEKEIKIVIGIVVIATIPQLMDYFMPLESPWLTFVYNIYTPIEFFLFSILFKKYFSNKNDIKIFCILNIFYVIISLVILIYFGLVSRFLYEWVCLNNLIYVAYIYMIFFKQYERADTKDINFSIPVFWIFTGIFIYSACSSITFPIRHYVMTHGDSRLKNILIIHHLANTALYTFFAVGIFKETVDTKRKNLKF